MLTYVIVDFVVHVHSGISFYVCLEVADFSVMFACWDFVEPIRYVV